MPYPAGRCPVRPASAAERHSRRRPVRGVARRVSPAPSHLAILRRDRADRERAAVVDDGRAGDAVVRARAGVVGVVVVALPVEALFIRCLPRRRRDAEGVGVGRPDHRGSGRQTLRGFGRIRDRVHLEIREVRVGAAEREAGREPCPVGLAPSCACAAVSSNVKEAMEVIVRSSRLNACAAFTTSRRLASPAPVLVAPHAFISHWQALVQANRVHPDQPTVTPR